MYRSTPRRSDGVVTAAVLAGSRDRSAHESDAGYRLGLQKAGVAIVDRFRGCRPGARFPSLTMTTWRLASTAFDGAASVASVASQAIGSKVWPVLGLSRAVGAAFRAFTSRGSTRSSSPGTPHVAGVTNR